MRMKDATQLEKQKGMCTSKWEYNIKMYPVVQGRVYEPRAAHHDIF